MPLVYICEMVCDFKARSEEFGTDIRNYINNTAIKLWGISEKDEIYKVVIKYVDLLCESPFEIIK